MLDQMAQRAIDFPMKSRCVQQCVRSGIHAGHWTTFTRNSSKHVFEDIELEHETAFSKLVIYFFLLEAVSTEVGEIQTHLIEYGQV